MKKLLFIFACFFLIGCQTNEEPVDDQEPETEEEENQADGIEQDQNDDENVEVEDVDDDDENADEETDSAPIEEPDEEIEPEEEPEVDPEDEVEEENGSYSSDEAVDLVREQIQGTDSDIGLTYNFDGEDDQGNYRIQVFEVVDHGDGESHTATYGWYLVNSETGEITDMFE